MPEGDERAAKGVLLAIADGVGGHAHGREAAEYSVRSLLADYFSTAHTWSVQKSLDTVLGAANRWLLAQSARTAETAGIGDHASPRWCCAGGAGTSRTWATRAPTCGATARCCA